MAEPILNKGNSALLIVDVQERFCGKSSDIAEMVGRLEKFISKIRSHSLPVIWAVKVEAKDKYGTPDFIPDFYKISPETGDEIFGKRLPSSFFDTELHYHLKANSIQNLIITGVYASACVYKTATDSSQLGYNTVVVNELVSDGDDTGEYLTRTEMCLSELNAFPNCSVILTEDVLAALNCENLNC